MSRPGSFARELAIEISNYCTTRFPTDEPINGNDIRWLAEAAQAAINKAVLSETHRCAQVAFDRSSECASLAAEWDDGEDRNYELAECNEERSEEAAWIGRQILGRNPPDQVPMNKANIKGVGP